METSVNNKCKAFTSLEQSKKLAEILPIETADMFYRNNGIDAKLMWEQNAQKVDSPCWSLAALLSVLSFPSLRYDIEDGEGGWIVSCEKNDKMYLSYYKDNPVDACYELILKLHEQKLL